MIRRARVRLTAWYAAIFAAMLAVLLGAAFFLLQRSLDAEIDRGIETVAQAWIDGMPDLETLRPLDLEREFDGETADVFVLVFRADGALVANPQGLEAEEFVEHGLVAPALRGIGAWSVFSEDGQRMRLLVTPIRSGGRIVGAVAAGRSLSTYDRQLRTLVVVLGALGLAGLVMATGGGYLLAGRALRPIATAYERQRAFVGDASHELRSPLAVILASSELLQREETAAGVRESADEIHETALEAAALVDDLLTLTRAEQASDARAPVTDVAASLAAVVDQLRPLVEAHGPPPALALGAATARIEERDLRRIARALVENAVAHTPPGTAIAIASERDGEESVIRVSDDGPGVPADALDRIFERFSRVDRARTPGSGHSGLGLAIVRAIAARSGGSASARNLPGGGFAVEVRLPVD